MKKGIAFIFIFFIFFSMYFKLAGSSATDCHFYINGICQTWISYDTTGYVEETAEAPTQTISDVSGKATSFSISLITLIFQLLGMVVLLILLVIMIEELAKSL